MRLQPDGAEACLTLGSLPFDQRRALDAIRDAEEVLLKRPQDLAALNLLGSARLSTREYDKAIQAFQRYRSTAPQDPRGAYLLGLALAAQQRPDDAIKQFEAALALSPPFPDPLARIVELQCGQGRHDLALARVKLQQTLTGDSAQQQNLLGLIHVTRNKAAHAEEAFLQAIALDPQWADPYVRLAEVYRASGRPAEALAKANAALKLDAKNVEALMVLGYTYEQQGELPRARQSYERALNGNPRFAPAANNLAWMLAARGGDLDRARSLAEVAYQESPEDPHISDTFGWILLQTGEQSRAVGLLSESAAKLPAEPGILYHLGVALGSTGDTSAARETLKRALSSKSEFTERAAARRALAALG